MQVSGLILDIYDDFKGDVLRSLYPTQDAMPDFVKSAQVLSSEDRQRLPDDVFALVMTNGDHVLRKFACVDEGNTILSVQYFLKNAHKLPGEAQKTAAQNLVTACGWYDIAVPEPLAKIADVTGTCDMPYQEPSNKTQGTSKTVIKKASEGIGHLVKGHKKEHGNFGPEETEKYDGYTKGKNMEALPQMKQLKPHVDTTEKKASVQVMSKEASCYALPSQKKYPLDGYDSIKTASNYFAEYHAQFTPAERREYALNLVKRANEVGLIVSDVARRYGNIEYAKHDDMKVAFELRDKQCAWDEGAVSMFHELFEKRAELAPEVFAEVLGQLDKTAGIAHLYDQGIPDPFLTTYGGVKLAEEADEFSEIIGNDLVWGTDLKRLARSERSYCHLKHVFDEDFVKEFKKDPVGIFKSMPMDQKKLLARMAAEAA